MKHLASNIMMIALAAFTLFFAAVSPPWTEASAARAENLLSTINNTNPTVSLTGEDAAYTALRPYVESRGGKLVYNSENDTIDIVVNGISFSLLLQENTIRLNGRELPGRFCIQNGETYIETAWIDAVAGG